MAELTGGPFISEFHYDNAGADTGEFVEVCVPAGSSAAGFTLELYNGNGGAVYDSFDLDDVDPANICVDPADGNTYYLIDTPGIQNGAPDGIALVNAAGAVCEFISYEGTLTATSGPALGMTSTDIGVAEGSATPIGTSIQLDPAGGGWMTGLPETPKAMNICFLEGTNILTNKGYRKIETLNLGDTVITNSGEHLPIKWIGIQTKVLSEIQDPITTLPVKISKDAIAMGIPTQELHVSPNHAVYIEGLLINAGALVNDINIIQYSPSKTFKYFHIELDSHQLIIAEGLPSESYLPQNEKRSAFDNHSEFLKHYPEGRKIILWPLDYPRISSQAKVPSYIQDKITKAVKVKKIA